MSHVLIAAVSCIGLSLVALVLLRSEKGATGPSTRTGTTGSFEHLPTWSTSLLQSFDTSELVEAPRQSRPDQPPTPLISGDGHFPENRLVREGRNLVLEIEEFLAQQSR